jgi:hypothetical protein
MTATGDGPAHDRRIRVALIVIAAIESLGALRDLPAIFYDFNPATPIGKFAQTLTSVELALAAPLTLAALYFAVARRLRLAIAAIAIRIAVTWLCDLPSIAIHGIEWSTSCTGRP